MTTPENVIECTTEIEDNTDKQNEKKNTTTPDPIDTSTPTINENQSK